MSKKQLRWISGLLSVLLVLFLALPAAAAEDVEPTGEELIAAQEEPTSAPYEEPSEAPVTEPTVPVTEPTTEAPHTHSFGKWMLARAASNKKNGVFKRTCTVCGKAQTKSIARVALVALSRKEKTYSGKALTTGVTVKDKAGKTLKAGRDDTVKFKNNKNVGTATAVVSGKGNYRFTVSRTFRIVPQGTKLTKALPSVTKAILRWKPVNAQADAYQVQYSTDKAFKKGAKTVRLGGKNTAYTVLTGLKADTTYFVRIRVLRTVKKSTFASGWSAAKAIKTITNSTTSTISNVRLKLLCLTGSPVRVEAVPMRGAPTDTWGCSWVLTTGSLGSLFNMPSFTSLSAYRLEVNRTESPTLYSTVPTTSPALMGATRVPIFVSARLVMFSVIFSIKGCISCSCWL